MCFIVVPGLAAAAPAGTTVAIDHTIARAEAAPIWASDLAPSIDLDALIDEEVTIAEARRRLITVDKADVMSAMDEIKRQNQLDDAQLDAILKQQGYSRARYHLALERQLLILRARNQLVLPQVMVSDTAIAIEGKARKLPVPLSQRDKETVQRDLRKQAFDAQAVTWLAGLRKRAWIERRATHVAKPSTAKPSDLTGAIKKLTVKGAPTAVQTTLLADLAKLRDKPLELDQLRGAVSATLATPGVADLDLRAVQLAAGIELIVEVIPEPVLRGLSAIELDTKTPVAIAMPKPATGQPLDAKRVHEIAMRLHDELRQKGHLDVDVSWRRIPVSGGVDVVIEVKAGAGSTIASIGFTGNTIDAKQLEKLARRWLVVGDPVLEDNLRVTTTALESFYFDRGFALVKVSWLKPTAGKSAVVFQITEGPQFRVGAISISGRPAGEHAQHRKLFGVKPGDLFSRKAISDGRQRLIDALKVDVTPLTFIDLDKRTIALTLEIAPATP